MKKRRNITIIISIIVGLIVSVFAILFYNDFKFIINHQIIPCILLGFVVGLSIFIFFYFIPKENRREYR